MISRKDKILNKPYEERKYENHRRKVKSAMPAIDNRPPNSRQHVRIKSKKYLMEKNQMDKIQRHNFLLLQKLNDIKKKCRVDHYWSSPLPQMVKNKVALYDICIPDIIDYEVLDENDEEMEEIERRLRELGIRKANCNACSPKTIKELKVSEERIPWDEEKEMVLRRERSKSLPIQKIHVPNSKKTNRDKSPFRRIKSCVSGDLDRNKQNTVQPKRNNLISSLPQKLVLTRGSLKLSVNFPVDTHVTFQDGNHNKLISGGFCQCKKNEMLNIENS
ncbi:uncharacterized protein LOC123677456 isoform X1 [Harmonia axyridis]|uniref:uncharacterized protein LOC123677456 isoform X1 n=1 Tax=Harmonia axyridis TaxID=115357 RepID=UPI001E276FD2|nr:uncharacterized protein LOC123677456 isoform X1 [Harmonia axyridis]